MKSPYGIMSRPLSKEGKEHWDRIFTKEKAVEIYIKVEYDDEKETITSDICGFIHCCRCPASGGDACMEELVELIKCEGLILNITAE